ncbi:hypothetical protein AB0L59_38175 [Streptomyces sp. NPDC052109]
MAITTVLVVAAAGASTAYGITRRERTDVPGPAARAAAGTAR